MLSERQSNRGRGGKMDTKTTVCMCGHTVETDKVVLINPATKAVTWTEGLPYCENCIPVTKEDL
jgi:hypothetical protein